MIVWMIGACKFIHLKIIFCFADWPTRWRAWFSLMIVFAMLLVFPLLISSLFSSVRIFVSHLVIRYQLLTSGDCSSFLLIGVGFWGSTLIGLGWLAVLFHYWDCLLIGTYYFYCSFPWLHSFLLQIWHWLFSFFSYAISILLDCGLRITIWFRFPFYWYRSFMRLHLAWYGLDHWERVIFGTISTTSIRVRFKLTVADIGDGWIVFSLIIFVP